MKHLLACAARFAWLKGHNHISELASVNTPDQELGRQVLDFLRATH